MNVSQYEMLMGSVITAHSACEGMDTLVKLLQSEEKWFSIRELTDKIYYFRDHGTFDESHIRYMLKYLTDAGYVGAETRKEEWRDEGNHIVPNEIIEQYVLPRLNEQPRIKVWDEYDNIYFINNPRYTVPRLPNGQKVFQVTRAYYKWKC